MFSAETEKVRHDGKPVLLDLVYVSSLEIRRHIKIKPDAHPFDPKWEPYFENRRFLSKGKGYGRMVHLAISGPSLS